MPTYPYTFVYTFVGLHVAWVLPFTWTVARSSNRWRFCLQLCRSPCRGVENRCPSPDRRACRRHKFGEIVPCMPALWRACIVVFQLHADGFSSGETFAAADLTLARSPGRSLPIRGRGNGFHSEGAHGTPGLRHDSGRADTVNTGESASRCSLSCSCRVAASAGKTVIGMLQRRRVQTEAAISTPLLGVEEATAHRIAHCPEVRDLRRVSALLPL